MDFLTGWTIDLNKIPKYAEFHKTFKQHLNKSLSKLLLSFEDYTPEVKQEFKEFVYKHISNNTLTVKHYQTNDLGRFYGKNNISIIPIYKKIKHTLLFYAGYKDLDQIKGHPTIAVSIAEREGLELKTLKKYIYNFDEISNELIQYYSVKDETHLQNRHIKDLINIMIYGGSFNTWVKDLLTDKPNKGKVGFQIDNLKPLHPFIYNLNNDIQTLHKNIISNNPMLFNKVKKHDKTDYENECSCISYWFQIIENHALYLTYKWLSKEKIINNENCCLEYDGLCVKLIREIDDNDVINKLNDFIFMKMKIPIRYKWKPYDEENVNYTLINMIDTTEINEDENICLNPDFSNLFSHLTKEEIEKINEAIHASICNETDYSIAMAFNAVFNNTFKCIDVKQNRWFVYNNDRYWEENNAIVRNKISNEFYNLYQTYNDYLNHIAGECNHVDMKNKIMQIVKKSSSICKKLQTTNDKNNIMRELADIVYNKCFETKLNKQKNVLPLKNGLLLDMNTLDVKPRVMEDYFSFECPVNFIRAIPTDKYEFVDKYFNDLFCNNIELKRCFIDIIKSMVSGNKLRYVFFMIGDGRNGKSLFMKILKKLFGVIVKPISKDVIIQNKNKSSINTELEKLDKIRIDFISELKEDDILNVARIKSITGDDEMDIRTLFKTNGEMLSTVNMLYATNEMPRFKAEKAFIERFCVIPFINEFEIDTSFENNLLENLDYIFSYIMLYGSIRDNFIFPEAMKVAINEYVAINDNDTLKEYINTYINKNIPEHGIRGDWCIKRDDLIKSYNEYCKDMGYKDRRTATSFTRYITKLGIDKVESNHVLWFKNIQFKKNDDEEENENI